MTLYAFRTPCVAFPALETGVICSGRAVVEDSYICGRCSFREDRQSELNCCTAVNYLPVSLSCVVLFAYLRNDFASLIAYT